MKIYTRTGDDGSTSLFSGDRVPKSHLRVEAYGTVDELNSVLGVARSARPTAPVETLLASLQSELFQLGADLATPGESRHVTRIDENQIAALEAEIDRMDTKLPTLKNFILPGGTPAAAHLHVARTICRRAERQTVLLAAHDAVNAHAVTYLNRLSDFLFTLARYENLLAGVPEPLWRSGR